MEGGGGGGGEGVKALRAEGMNQALSAIQAMYKVQCTVSLQALLLLVLKECVA